MSKKYYIKSGTYSNKPSIDGSALYLNETVANIVTDMGFPNYLVGCCNLSTKPLNGQTLVWNSTTNKWEAGSLGGGALSNLAYTPSGLNGVITNSNGTGFTIPLVTTTNAGLATPAMAVALSATTPTNAQLGVGNTYISVVDPTTGAIDFVVDGITQMTITQGKITTSSFFDPSAVGFTKMTLAQAATVTGALYNDSIYIDSATNHLFRGSKDLENVASTATQISFDNTGTGMTATNLQDAIVELNNNILSLIDTFNQPV